MSQIKHGHVPEAPSALQSVDTLNVRDIGQSIEKAGFWFGKASRHELAKLKLYLGNPDVEETLVASPNCDLRRNSLTSRHGLGRFPFHTDDIVGAPPARYILLYPVSGAHLAPTLLVSLRNAVNGLPTSEKDELAEAVFVARSGRSSKYVCLYDKVSGVYRFNPDILAPTGERAERLWLSLLEALTRENKIKIHWRPQSVLVIDNHQMAHGRGPVWGRGKRVLRRCLIR